MHRTNYVQRKSKSPLSVGIRKKHDFEHLQTCLDEHVELKVEDTVKVKLKKNRCGNWMLLFLFIYLLFFYSLILPCDRRFKKIETAMSNTLQLGARKNLIQMSLQW
jgi:uncharacterized protein YqhQ